MLFRHGTRLGGVVVCALALWVSACSVQKSGNPNAPSSITPGPHDPRSAAPLPETDAAPPLGTGSTVLNVTGDIGWCGSPGVALTARLLERLPGDILLAGDIAYMKGTADDFRRCFDPEWGRMRGRFRAVPGNHEFEDPGAAGYFGYFGAAAGPGRRGYYAFRAATWHVLMLNSSEDMRRESAQWQWVRNELQQNRTRCTLAVWHHPFASSGPNGSNAQVRDTWQLLHEQGAEVVVSAHDHFYERFAPQTQDYRYDPNAIRQFIVGTGGAPLYRPATRGPNTEAVVETFGALKLTLNPSSYDWEFIEAATSRSIDRGSAPCH
jgi:hypothetical protein